MNDITLVGPLLLAVLLPVLVWWAASLLGRGVASYTAQIEIDRRLREVPGARARLFWMPWRRDSMACEFWARMPPGPERVEFGRLLRQHLRMMDLQAALYGVLLLILAGSTAFPLGVRAFAAGMLLLTLGWRWTSHRRYRRSATRLD